GLMSLLALWSRAVGGGGGFFLLTFSRIALSDRLDGVLSDGYSKVRDLFPGLGVFLFSQGSTLPGCSSAPL
ncbi:hypothetical protein A2U01_0056826, partial [Trifolium medium]|nr:hypothetical protein [Trifolium medium]